MLNAKGSSTLTWRFLWLRRETHRSFMLASGMGASVQEDHGSLWLKPEVVPVGGQSDDDQDPGEHLLQGHSSSVPGACHERMESRIDRSHSLPSWSSLWSLFQKRRRWLSGSSGNPACREESGELESIIKAVREWA